MPLLEVLSHPVWQLLAAVLLHFVWQGAVVGVVLALTLLVTKRSNWRYALSLIALVIMALSPAMTFYVCSDLSRGESAEPARQASVASATGVTVDESGLSTLLAGGAFYLVAAWLLGVTLLSLRLVAGYLAVRRLRRSARWIAASALPGLPRLTKRLRVDARVRVAATDLVCEAMVIGLWRPLVLLPAAWVVEMPAQTLEAIVAHELAHVRRFDLWINLFQRVIETLLFYHPAVWYVSHCVRREREKCCDELAVAATGERLAYVEALERVAHRRLAASPSVWATAMGGGKTMNLLERVRNVLGLRPATPIATYWPVGVAALALPALLWCAVVLMAPPAIANEDDAPRSGQREEEVERENDEADREDDADESEDEAEEEDDDKKDADRKRDGEREGDRPRDGEVRREGPRDGEGRRPEGPRDPNRPEGPRREMDRPGPREGQPPVPPELFRLIRELRAEVEQLRREVNELREGRGPRPEMRREGDRPFPREEGRRPPLGERERPREGAGPRDGEGRRPEGPRDGDRPGPRPERE